MLSPNAYSTPDRLAAFIEIPTPTGIQLTAMQALINSISSFINQYTSRTFVKTVHTREEIDTERGQTINLAGYPIISSQPFILERRNSQLKEDMWQVIDGLYYDVDTDAGIIHFMDGVYVFRGRKIYRVTYTSGFDFDNVTTFLGDTDGGDLELALWLIGKDVWLNKKVPTNVQGERIGDYQISYQRPTTGIKSVSLFNNPEALAILNNYQDVAPVGVLTPNQSI